MSGVPVLVIRESHTGHVEGVVMLQPEAEYARPLVAVQCAEPDEVENEIAYLRSLTRGESYMGCEKLENVEASDCAWALLQMPKGEQGEKEVLMYSGIEWFGGVVWPEKDPSDTLHLQSIADQMKIRVSAAKLAHRADLDVAREAQTLPGDYAVFERALRALVAGELDTLDDAEDAQAIQVLCQWWNTQVEEDQKLAGAFQIFQWEPKLKLFVSENPRQHPHTASDIAQMSSYALFEQPGRPTMALIFYRAREFNHSVPEGTQIYYANGDKGGVVNRDPEFVDVAYLALLEMHAYKAHLPQ